MVHSEVNVQQAVGNAPATSNRRKNLFLNELLVITKYFHTREKQMAGMKRNKTLKNKVMILKHSLIVNLGLRVLMLFLQLL